MKKIKRRQNTDAAKAEPIALWSLDTFFYAFIVVGVLFHWAALNYQIINGTRSAAWSRTNGVIVDVHTREHSQSNVNMKGASRPGGSGSTSHFYEVVPTYEYTIEGKKYVNNKVTTGGGWFLGGRVDARQKADNLVPGSPVVVYYDPADPASAVLEQGVAERTSSGMLVTIPAIGGAMGMAFNYFSRTRFPEQRRRLKLSIAAGTGAAVLAALAQWFVMTVLV